MGKGRRWTGVLCSIVLGGCGSVTDVMDEPYVAVPAPAIVLQGSISGLGTRRPLVLQYNGQDTCVDTQVTPNQQGVPCRFYGILGQPSSSFSFGALPVGTPYNITVKAQPYGKICSVADAAGVLGVATAMPKVACVNDPAVPRYAVTVNIAAEVAAIPSAKVTLTTEEGIQERAVAGLSSVDFPDALFDSQANLPVFKWFVTATRTEGSTLFNCNVTGGGNERFSADGQDTTLPPTGPVTNVQVTRCSFTVNAVVAYQPAAGHAALPMPAGGMALVLKRARTGIHEQTLQVDAFSTVGFSDVLSNQDAIFELAIARQPDGMHCVVGSASQPQWGGAVLLLEPLDANRQPNHGWVVNRNVRCRATPAAAARLRGTYQVATLSAAGEATPTRNFLTFFEDGTYLYGHHATGTVCSSACGVEHGFYVHDATANRIGFEPVTDTNGASGLSTTVGGFAVATTLTNVQRTPGPGATIRASLGTASWLLTEVESGDGRMAGAWVTPDHRRVWIFDERNYNGFHAGVNGLGNAQDGCYNIEDLGAMAGSFTRRGNATGTCLFNSIDRSGYFTLDVPNAATVPRAPQGFVGKWPQSTSNADGRPSSPVNFEIFPGTPDTLRIRETINGQESLDGVTPVSPEIILQRTRAN